MPQAALGPLYEKVAYFCQRCQNYGGANSVDYSGESVVLKNIDVPDPVIFDVGANEGQYLNLVKKHIPGARVHCFEPSSVAFRRLIQQRREGVMFNNFALGNERGEMSLFDTGSVQATLVGRVEGHQNTAERVKVERLDSYCKSQGIEAIDLLKIDTEGFELQVLKGASSMLETGKIKEIQFEFGGLSHIDQRIFLRDFFELLPEYEIGILLHNGVRYFEYHPRKEVFIVTNYLARRKK
jgi:FkbM family methyltransferase